MTKSCCFIGHRKVEDKNLVLSSLKDVIIELITKENVKRFIFGSKSEFDTLAWEIINLYKEKYDLKTIRYSCKSEYTCLSQEESEKMQNALDFVSKKENKILFYDDELKLNNVCNAGKNSYIIRNQEMIKASNICVFYYNNDKTINKLKQTANSGTKLALDFAKQNNKQIIIIKK